MRTIRPLFILLLGSSATVAGAAVPTWPVIELQARTNLLVNDNGWNLPPGSSFNSISAYNYLIYVDFFNFVNGVSVFGKMRKSNRGFQII